MTMNDYYVVTVDGARARFFTLAAADQPAVESGPFLIEEGEALINPEVESAGKELWSENKSGRMTSSASGMTHGYDDHRDQHRDEFKRRFAKLVAGKAVGMAQSKRAKRLVLAAEKQMLGFLRDALHVPAKTTFEICEMAKDLSKLSPAEIQAHLAREGLLPGRTGPG